MEEGGFESARSCDLRVVSLARVDVWLGLGAVCCVCTAFG